jgi:FKBP-type peptidyl-prolyl cis-trans isomerase
VIIVTVAITQHFQNIKDMKVETVTPGDGKTYPKNGDRVSYHYSTTLPSGRPIDTSKILSKPMEFVVGGGKVIKCWDEAITKMSLG